MRSVVFRLSGVVGAGLLACTLSGGAGATTEVPAATPTAAQPAIGAPAGAFDTFLDRLMRSESNGQDAAKNPRSTALGAFQFIKSTFLDVMRRHFPADVANLNESDILALRTDRGFARRAAQAFSKENLDYLADRGLKPDLRPPAAGLPAGSRGRRPCPGGAAGQAGDRDPRRAGHHRQSLHAAHERRPT